jgi:hypothetical protein
MTLGMAPRQGNLLDDIAGFCDAAVRLGAGTGYLEVRGQSRGATGERLRTPFVAPLTRRPNADLKGEVRDG